MIQLAVMGAALGYVGYELFFGNLSSKKATPAKVAAAPKIQVPPIMNTPVKVAVRDAPPIPNAPPPQPVVAAKTVEGNPIIVIAPVNPENGKVTLEATLATHGSASPAARALYDYLLKNGTKPNPDLAILVNTFQKASNADAADNHINGTLPENGAYEARTAGALTVYTGNPISPDPAVPTPAGTEKVSDPGPAAIAASNLYAYMKVHGNDKSATLKPLVLAFQKAVNTDPKFTPGPASSPEFTSIRIIKEKLTEDGLYGPKTSDALAAMSFERIKP